MCSGRRSCESDADFCRKGGDGLELGAEGGPIGIVEIEAGVAVAEVGFGKPVAERANLGHEVGTPVCEMATEVLVGFRSEFEGRWLAGMLAKLGLTDEHVDDRQMVDELLALMHAQRVDYTGCFRAVADDTARPMFAEPGELDAWMQRWQSRLNPSPERTAAMHRVNPVYIARNHLVEAALTAAVGGNLVPVEELVAVLASPYDERPGLGGFAQPGPEDAGYQTFCGT